MNSAAYTNAVIADMKANPVIARGMLVKVFQHTCGRPFSGYGQIINIEWSNFYSQYLADIQMDDGRVEENVLACNVERVSYSGSDLGAVLRAGTINGGRA